MDLWFQRLTNLHKLLADSYLDVDETRLIVKAVGLQAAKIKFSTRASDNWYSILEEAEKSQKLTKLLEYVRDDSRYPDIAKAYQEYLDTPDSLEEDKPGNGLRRSLLDWLLRNRRKLIAGSAVVIVLSMASLAIFFFLIPKTIAGHISCSDSSSHPGMRLEAATVVAEGTDYSAITDKEGFFELKVPRYQGVEALEVLYALGRHRVTLDSVVGTDFKVVPCQGETLPIYHSIPFDWWKHTDLKDSVMDTCQSSENAPQIRLYTLRPQAPIKKTEPGLKLYLTLITSDPWTIVDAIVILPAGIPEPYAEMRRDAHAYKWSIEMPGNELDIKIQACLGSHGAAPPPTDITLISTYYFQ